MCTTTYQAKFKLISAFLLQIMFSLTNIQWHQFVFLLAPLALYVPNQWFFFSFQDRNGFFFLLWLTYPSTWFSTALTCYSSFIFKLHKLSKRLRFSAVNRNEESPCIFLHFIPNSHKTSLYLIHITFMCINSAIFRGWLHFTCTQNCMEGKS